MVLTGPLVEADVLAEFVDLAVVDLNRFGVDVGDGALTSRADEQARVRRHIAFHPGCNNRRLGYQQRHSLPLHVGAHQRPVRVVMLKERDQAGGDTNHLTRSDVDVFNLVWRHENKVAVVAGDNGLACHLAARNRGISWSQVGLVLFVGTEPDDVVKEFALRDLPVRRDQKAV